VIFCAGHQDFCTFGGIIARVLLTLVNKSCLSADEAAMGKSIEECGET
jgi:hypothetical protein